MTPATLPDKIWTTLLTRESYIPGVLVMAKSLQNVGSKYPFVVMITSSLEQSAKDTLAKHSIPTYDIENLSPKSLAEKTYGADHRFKDTWTKLQAFAMVQCKRVVMVDSDMLVRRNMDELFDMDLEKGHIAACHACCCNPKKISHYPAEWIPENCAYTAFNQDPESAVNAPPVTKLGLLNSGLIVIQPSQEQYDRIVHELDTSSKLDSYLFPDQDFLADVYKNKWTPLPYIYNALKTLRWCHPDIWSDERVKNVHYILSNKPWTLEKPTKAVTQGSAEEIADAVTLKWWWDAHDTL